MEIPKFIFTFKILEAISSFPQYNFYIQKLLLKKPEEWIKLSPQDLHTLLSQISKGTNNLAQEEVVGLGVVGEERKKTYSGAVRVPVLVSPPLPPPPTKNQHRPAPRTFVDHFLGQVTAPGLQDGGGAPTTTPTRSGGR